VSGTAGPIRADGALTTRIAAVAIFASTLLLAGIALVLVVVDRATPPDTAWGFRGYEIILALGGGVVGFVLSIRVPGNRVGWILSLVGLLSGVQAVVDEYTIAGLGVGGAGTSLPGVAFAMQLGAWIWVWPVALAAIALPLVFPTGRLSVPSDRRIGLFAIVGVSVASVALAIAPGSNVSEPASANPFGLPLDAATIEAIGGLAYPPLGIAALLSAASVIRRFRRSTGETRQQLKWFAFAMAGVGLTLGLGVGFGPSLEPSVRLASSVAIIASFIGLIVAVGIAVLRYRLYDIDRLVSRTLSYGVVTALLIGSYASAVLVLQDPLGSITGGDTLPVAISTLIVAGLFDPLRRRVQHTVDRRFDRRRVDSERTTTEFGDRLRDEVDLPTLAADLDSTIRGTVSPSFVNLWLRETVR
jgi:hypothetical protein